jgi:hypothetical protein
MSRWQPRALVDMFQIQIISPEVVLRIGESLYVIHSNYCTSESRSERQVLKNMFLIASEIITDICEAD